MKLLGLKKLFGFNFRVPFKGLAKYGTSFSNSEWAIVNKMKLRDIFLLQKTLFSVFIPPTTYFELKKYEETFTVADKI